MSNDIDVQVSYELTEESKQELMRFAIKNIRAGLITRSMFLEGEQYMERARSRCVTGVAWECTGMPRRIGVYTGEKPIQAGSVVEVEHGFMWRIGEPGPERITLNSRPDWWRCDACGRANAFKVRGEFQLDCPHCGAGIPARYDR